MSQRLPLLTILDHFKSSVLHQIHTMIRAAKFHAFLVHCNVHPLSSNVWKQNTKIAIKLKSKITGYQLANYRSYFALRRIFKLGFTSWTIFITPTIIICILTTFHKWHWCFWFISNNVTKIWCSYMYGCNKLFVWMKY